MQDAEKGKGVDKKREDNEKHEGGCYNFLLILGFGLYMTLKMLMGQAKGVRRKKMTMRNMKVVVISLFWNPQLMYFLKYLLYQCKVHHMKIIRIFHWMISKEHHAL
jgi:hypothetical protein